MPQKVFSQIFASQSEKVSQKQLKRGEILYHMGDEPKNIYLLESGLIGLFHVESSGKETFFRVFSEGAILGHRSYFASENYHASAICLVPSKVQILAASQCTNYLKDKPEILLEALKSLAIDLGTAETRLAGLKDKPVIARVSEALLFLKLKHPDYSWTRKEIAEYSGSTIETVARVMTQLSEEGFLEKQGRDFLILDQDNFVNWISEQY